MFLLRFLALLAGSVGVISAKECGTISRGKELKQLVATSNVLVALSSEDESTTKDLCDRLKQTPDARVKDFELVTAVDHNVQRKVWESSRPAPTGIMERLWYKLEMYVSALRKARDPSPMTTPAFVLFQKGESYEQGNGLRYTGEEVSADTLSTFVATWLQTKKLGSYVYSMGTYDLIAAKTMSWVEKYTPQGLVPRLWVHGVGRLTHYLVQPTSLEFESQLAQMYINCASKVLQHGPTYPKSQIERLERMLGDDDTKITPLQREDLSQRLFIWKKFAEPIEVSNDELLKFTGRLALNLFSVLAMAILIPLLIFGQVEYDEEEEAADEKVGEGDDDNAAAKDDEVKTTENGNSSSDSTTMTKEEKRAAAIQRAKESMEADKKKVEAVLAKKQQSDPTTPSTYSRDALNEMTVAQLKDILRERNEKVSGIKSELVDRILGEE